MFKKEAEEYYNGQYDAWLEGEDSFALEEEIEQAFKDGAEFGYNKANEWHDLRKNPDDLPKDYRFVVGSNGTDWTKGFYKDKKWNFIPLCGFLRVIAWKEIVLPKEIKEND